jgi:hypothetical protein
MGVQKSTLQWLPSVVPGTPKDTFSRLHYGSSEPKASSPGLSLHKRTRTSAPPIRPDLISFRCLFAAHPKVRSRPFLQIAHLVVATLLIQQAGRKRTKAHTGSVTVIQRFESAAHKIAGTDFEQAKAGPNGVNSRARLLKRVFDIDLEHCPTAAVP